MAAHHAHPPPSNDNEDFRCLRHATSVYHDIFISYRVNTEKKLADKIALLLDGYEKENGQKVRTFLDSNCLLDGGDWEKNFLAALHHSTLIVLLISEAGLDLASASYPGLTKIQAADKEQDNCLLEYEYAMQFHDAGRVDILVLCVSKEATLGKIRCKVKFPTSEEGINQRLAMYASTQEHQHRDHTKGPKVDVTMGKLLRLMKPSNGQAPSFAHIDPDDAASRIPEIMWKLNEAESKLTAKKRFYRAWRDMAFVKHKIFGMLLGIVMPLVSLLCIMTVRTTRHKAVRFGVLTGHALIFLAIAILALYSAFKALPKSCSSYEACVHNYNNLAKLYPHFTETCYIIEPDNSRTQCYEFPPEYKSLCSQCFCNEWLYYCDNLESDQKAFLFLGLLSLFFSVSLFIFSATLHRRSQKKRHEAPTI